MDISSASKDNFTIEIPLSSRTPLRSVTMDDCSHDLAVNVTAMAKEHFNLLESSTVNDSCDHKGKELDDEASTAEDCEDDAEQVRSPTTAAQTNQARKRVVNNSNKKKPVRKRRVTANIAATKYEIGE